MSAVRRPSRPISLAASAIGVGVTARPRPAGRSGCVTMRTISCPAPHNARSVGSPNSPLPAKITRTRATLFLPLPVAAVLAAELILEVFECLACGHAGDGSHAVDQERA